jgi:hypothetical protein
MLRRRLHSALRGVNLGFEGRQLLEVEGIVMNLAQRLASKISPHNTAPSPTPYHLIAFL